MVNEFACPHCGKNLGYSTEPPGATLMCPYCEQFFTITTGPAPTAPPAPEPLLSEPPAPEPAIPEPVASEPVITETVLTSPESEDDLSTETPPPVSRPIYSEKTPPHKKKVPQPTSSPYIIPEMPRASSATAVGYLGICAGVLGLLIALVLAAALIWAKLNPEFADSIRNADLVRNFIPEKLQPDLFTGAAIIASFLGVFNLVWLWACIGLLKKKKSAPVILWILFALAALSLIIGACLVFKYLTNSTGAAEIN